ncbi:MAG TPA: GvpL/GvpF family gas vesicle protein [Vicinamibacterales bacterium]|nr:GvpL/GvpF family gas vesicle protein [Vicinamibacterales bacterium]
MALYVFALLETAPRPPLPRGLDGPIGLRRAGSWIAAVETRRRPPAIDLATLQRQHDVVERLARRSRAILPVRFGTILTARELDDVVRGGADDVRAAFARVRGCVQMTWRMAAAPRAQTRTAPASGRAYLAARLRQARPPRRWNPVRDAMTALVAAERYEPASGGARDALYHLVPRGDVRSYLIAARGVRAALPAARLTGPTAPYAFTPEILRASGAARPA